MGAAQNWESSFEQALLISKEESKPIILVFSGSDWCAPCIKLERDIWQSEEFKKYADTHYVLFKADFPRKKENKLPAELASAYKTLAVKYNPKGYFPFVLVLNSEEKVLGETGFKKITPNEYIKVLNSFVK